MLFFVCNEVKCVLIESMKGIWPRASMQVISVGTLTKIQVNNLPHSLPPPPPPQAMLSFDDQTHIYTRKTIYLHLPTLYWGGGGGGEGVLDGLHIKCPNYL